ncbi:hypothetical protein EDF56_1154 [Novosphingobium sp. PhB165]|nr:hypothetical protein EDF56_1154 [Novosphingobium sp. PhB165]
MQFILSEFSEVHTDSGVAKCAEGVVTRAVIPYATTP